MMAFHALVFIPGDYWRGLTGPLIDFLFISTQELTGTQTAKTADGGPLGTVYDERHHLPVGVRS